MKSLKVAWKGIVIESLNLHQGIPDADKLA